MSGLEKCECLLLYMRTRTVLQAVCVSNHTLFTGLHASVFTLAKINDTNPHIYNLYRYQLDEIQTFKIHKYFNISKLVDISPHK